MSLLHAWLVLPAVLGAVAVGIGLLVEAGAGRRLPGVLLLPVGLAGVLTAGSLVTSIGALAPAAPWVVLALGLAGWALGHRRLAGVRTGAPARAAAAAALAVLAVYAAPLVLSGEATFLGFVKLDDTATWLAFSDQVLAEGRSVAGLEPSSFRLQVATNFDQAYPLGAFVGLGVAGKLALLDLAWAIQPYMALLAAGLALSAFSLLGGLGAGPRLRALGAFVAAQPALLFGYVAWGGIKEITLAALLAVLVALTADLLREDGPDPAPAPARAAWRRPLALAVVAAALAFVAGPSAAALVGPPVLVLAVVWARRHGVRAAALRLAPFAGLALLLALPAVLDAGDQIAYTKKHLADEDTDRATLFGNLLEPLRGWQLAGPWPVGDFRLRPATAPTVLLVGTSILAALAGIALSLRRRRPGVALYAGVALLTVLGALVTDATPWLMGKTLAIASPAIPLAAVAGALLLHARVRAAGVALLAVLAGGVLVSNVLAYTEVTVAPRERFEELADLGEAVDEQGPTFANVYDVYAIRHFLREGAPVAPAEFREPTLTLTNGTYLTKAAYADVDAFPPSTLAPYRSIVVGAWPGASRPSSLYREVRRGATYALYQRAERPDRELLRRLDGGDTAAIPYCGQAQNGGFLPLCPAQPVGRLPCDAIRQLGRDAAAAGGRVAAFERRAPIIARADQTRWPAPWTHDAAARTLNVTEPGTLEAQIAVDRDVDYELWLGGSFSARGLRVRVDGQDLGTIADRLDPIGQQTKVGTVRLAAGVHRIELEAPEQGLGPGQRDRLLGTTLTQIVLQPLDGPRRLVDLPAERAGELCGRVLDWAEAYRPLR